MQIREKGKKVLLIRTEYIPEKKRTIGRTIASQDIELDFASEEVEKVIERDECEQLDMWLYHRREAKKLNAANETVEAASKDIRRLADALLKRGRNELPEGWGESVLDELDNLKKSLKKSGIKLTRPKKSPAAKKDEDLKNGDNKIL